MDRDRQIMRTSVVGIVCNVVLAAFKAAIGLITGSIAIVLDAVNNLSDVLSSLVTIIGVRLAARPADYEHPYGHGRAEYLSAIVIASLVLAAGLASLRESVAAILDPQLPRYDTVSLLILVVAIGVKVALGRHFVAVGRRVSSESLVASGTDATMDAVIAAATVVAALVYLASGLCVEPWLATVISLVIVNSGWSILRETLSKVLGERVDGELTQRVRQTVESVEGVRASSDLTLHDYGPGQLQGSVHVEVDDTMTAAQVDALSTQVKERVWRECRVRLVAVGIHATNPEGADTDSMRAEVARIVWQHPGVREMHGFYVDEGEKTVRFDVVLGFEDQHREATREAIVSECLWAYPAYRFVVVLDTDIAG